GGGTFTQPTKMDINSTGGGVTMDPVTVATGANFGTLTDVTVTVNILWPNLTELKIELVSPTGKTVTLLNNRVDAPGATISTTQGTTGANMGILTSTNLQVGTTFDDSAARSIVDTANGASAPFTGHFRPEEPLSGILSQLNGLTKTDVDG